MRRRNNKNSKVTADSHAIATPMCMCTLAEDIVVADSTSKEEALEVEMDAVEKMMQLEVTTLHNLSHAHYNF